MVPKMMLTRRKSAGIRVPDNNICLQLVELFGSAIISTTATSADGTIFHDPSLIHDYFRNQIDIVIDGGPVPGEPSSVIRMMGDEPEILRRGKGDVSMFE